MNKIKSEGDKEEANFRFVLDNLIDKALECQEMIIRGQINTTSTFIDTFSYVISL